MSVFRTAYKRDRDSGEINAGKTLVDVACYVPPRKLIQSYIRAGVRLAAARAAGEYDFAPGEEVDDSFSDETREPGFDYGDAAVAAMEASYALHAHREAAEAAAREAAEKSVREALDEASVPDAPK